MTDEEPYSISMDVRFEPLELIDVSKLIKESEKKWQNFSLSEVNDCVVRLGVIHGEFSFLEEVFFVDINRAPQFGDIKP